MNILFVSSEVAPFAKTGGLGDVSAALPRYLRALGHDVRVVMPMYARVHDTGRTFTRVVPELTFPLGEHRVRASVYVTDLPGSDVPVYAIRCPALYDRPEIYSTEPDEHLRFAALSWASLAACQHLRFAPDIVHANDWPTALLPLLLRTMFAWDRLFARTRTVLTVHNIGHQGTFDARVLPDTGLADAAGMVHQDELRAGRFSYLLTGLLYAHAITTVSPTYAREIQTPAHGVGMDPYLRMRRDVLSGVLNGIDETVWDPATDPLIPAVYTPDDLTGKSRCKSVLLSDLGLPHHPRVPVVGVVSRLAWQKGFDLCTAVLPGMLRRRAFQLVVLGTGEPRYEQFFASLARAFPRQVAYRAAFSEVLAHRIEAGADLFLMPSRYEPCGLNQMYSLRYGTVPVVHRTGGLADTVRPYEGASASARTTARGTGFVFDHFDETGLAWALHRALDVWGTGDGADREAWQALQRNGMRQPLGWSHRVGEYVDIYRQLTAGA